MSWFAKLCATKRSRSSDPEEPAVVPAQTPPKLRGTTTPAFVNASLDFGDRKDEMATATGLSESVVGGISREEEGEAPSMKESDDGRISSGNEESLSILPRGLSQINSEGKSSPSMIEPPLLPALNPTRSRSLTPLSLNMTTPAALPPRVDLVPFPHPGVSHLISLIPPTPIEGGPSLPLPLTQAAIPFCPPLPSSISNSSPGTSPASSLKAQRRRNSSHNGPHGTVKETLNAYESDGGEGGVRSVNQYVLKGELGRGSYATVERATDRETGIDYAVKEFSKARLRRRAASELIRHGNPSSINKQGAPGASRGRGRTRPPLIPAHVLDPDEQGPDNLALIKSEVAIMKKVDHPNLCSIHEVIDVTASDSLLVVMELCEGGPITHVSLEKDSPAYSEEKSRGIFIQLLLGLSYLHHSGIVHRDIKPDNCLFMGDKETVKIVDFGVSEMFVKSDDDKVEKSVGSPAFMAPELCGSKHDHLHGFACDIWSLGATLFALVCGRLPFHKDNIIDLFASICDDPLVTPSYFSPELQNLLSRMLNKNPHGRITMLEMWEDAWVTENGKVPLPDYEENCAEPIGLPTEAEVDSALRSLRSSFLVAKIANKFRRGVIHRRSLSANGERLSLDSNSPPSSPPLHPSSPIFYSTSPLSSPNLEATPYHTTHRIPGPLFVPALSISTLSNLPTPLRKETVSSISTLDSEKGENASPTGIGGERQSIFDAGRCSSPNSSVGIAAPGSSHGVDILCELPKVEALGAKEVEAQAIYQMTSEPEEME